MGGRSGMGKLTGAAKGWDKEAAQLGSAGTQGQGRDKPAPQQHLIVPNDDRAQSAGVSSVGMLAWTCIEPGNT